LCLFRELKFSKKPNVSFEDLIERWEICYLISPRSVSSLLGGKDSRPGLR
jgi:hypothetical protein